MPDPVGGGGDGDGGITTKTRSALTPVADNEKHVVTVPYVALKVHGQRTQWCYARHYRLFQEGFQDPISDSVLYTDLEEKLNGRDDYGLCYYTLTGTVTARGYPTFLIIFERLSKAKVTRVHFHRVHPKRVDTESGKQTPSHKLIAKCYQYMVGNIPASEIAAQQGDLVFIKLDQEPKNKQVSELTAPFSFESHTFTSTEELKLYTTTSKEPKNRLGFVKSEGTFGVNHPEHENIEGLGAGWYDIRRCKSWEANPKAIWTAFID